MSRIWWVNAFCGAAAAGNATCVFLEDPGGPPLERWEIAQALRAPDTVFVAAEADQHTWSVRFFSPYEGEMTFCGQGLLAADAALRASSFLSDSVLSLRTQTGMVSTRRDEGRVTVSWFEVPRERVSIMGVADGLPTAARAPATIVDSGRRRGFVLLSSRAEVQGVSLEPHDVLNYCRERDLSGLCFFSFTDDRRVCLRVFTVSLAGGEDASTGGAVLGLSALLPPGVWTVEQGRSHFLSRGMLLLDSASSSSALAVGGEVQLVAVGERAGAGAFGVRTPGALE